MCMVCVDAQTLVEQRVLHTMEQFGAIDNNQVQGTIWPVVSTLGCCVCCMLDRVVLMCGNNDVNNLDVIVCLSDKCTSTRDPGHRLSW